MHYLGILMLIAIAAAAPRTVAAQQSLAAGRSAGCSAGLAGCPDSAQRPTLRLPGPRSEVNAFCWERRCR